MALGRKKLLFRERTLKTSKFIVGSSFSGLGTRLVTELTVYMPRSRAHLCRVRPWYGLVRGVATTRARSSSWICILLCHCAIEIKLRVNENIMIDSIDELR